MTDDRAASRAASRAAHQLPEERVADRADPTGAPSVPAEERAGAILEESDVRTALPVPDERRTSADSA